MKSLVIKTSEFDTGAVLLVEDDQSMMLISKCRGAEFWAKRVEAAADAKKEPADRWLQENSELFSNLIIESADLDPQVLDEWIMQQQIVRCENCDYLIRSSDNYCSHCGKRRTHNMSLQAKG